MLKKILSKWKQLVVSDKSKNLVTELGCVDQTKHKILIFIHNSTKHIN